MFALISNRPDILLKEAAAIIGCSRSFAFNLAAEGQLHGWRLTDGGRIRITSKSLRRYLAHRFRAEARGDFSLSPPLGPHGDFRQGALHTRKRSAIRTH
jgi:excisionase family DNA binding protein